MAKKGKNSFYLQGTILAAASVISRLMGIAFRIPLTNIIGDEGNGAYSNAYEVYNIALLLSTYSIPIAVSRLISDKESKKEYINSTKTFRIAMIFSVFLGIIATSVTFFYADFFASTFFESPMCALPIRFLAPTIFVFAIAGTLRGFYQGKNTVIPTSISQILEQFFHVAVGLIAAYYFMKFTSVQTEKPFYGAAGATFGTFVGAVVSLIFLLIVFFAYYPIQKNREFKDVSGVIDSNGHIFKILLITVFPIILNQTLFSVSGLLDSIVFNNIMDVKGFSESTRLMLLGKYSGKYRLLSNVPLAVASAVGTAVIPNIVMAKSRNDHKMLCDKVGSAIKFNMMIVIPCALGMAVLSKPIMYMLFKDTSELSTNLMIFGAPAIIFYAYSQTTGNVLQGLGKLKFPALHALISIALYVSVDIYLLEATDLGVYALLIGHTLFAFVICLLNGLRIHVEINRRQEFFKTFFMPLLCSALMCVAARYTWYGMMLLINKNTISTLIAILAGAVVYVFFMVITKTLSEKEIYDLPMGGRFVRILRKLHLIR